MWLVPREVAGGCKAPSMFKDLVQKKIIINPINFFLCVKMLAFWIYWVIENISLTSLVSFNGVV